MEPAVRAGPPASLWVPVSAPGAATSYPPHGIESPLGPEAFGNQVLASGGMRSNASLDSLAAYFDSKIVLVDPAVQGQAAAGLDEGLDAAELSALDNAAVAHLLPDLDHTESLKPSRSGGRWSSGSAHEGVAPGGTPHAPAGDLRARTGQGSGDEDIFSALGGLELGGGGGAGVGPAAAAGPAATGEAAPADAAAALFAEHAPSDAPSRMLLVRGLAPEMPDEDVAALFAAHGEVRSVYTAAKRRGLVMVFYFDLRAAVRAAGALRGAALGGAPLDVAFTAPKAQADGGWLAQGTVVVFNLDPNTTNEQLEWIFSKFGDVRGVRQSEARPSQKFIEFFDVRHAAAALRAMNRAEGGAVEAHGGGTAAAAAPHRGGSLPQRGSSHSLSQIEEEGAAATGAAATAAAAAAALAAQQQEQQQRVALAAALSAVHQQQAAAAAMAAGSAQQQRGMPRPASHAVLDQLHGMSPPVQLGPISASWDAGTEATEQLLGLLGQHGARGGAVAAAAAAAAAHQQQQHQQQLQQHQLQQQHQLHQQHQLQQQQQQHQHQQQAALQHALHAGALLGSFGDLQALQDPLSKLGGSTAALSGSAPRAAGSGSGLPSGVPSMHVSDSASSITAAAAAGGVPSGPLFGAGTSTLAAQLQSLASHPSQQQAGSGQQAAPSLSRGLGSSEQLSALDAMVHHPQSSGMLGASGSFGSGLNLAGDLSSFSHLPTVAEQEPALPHQNLYGLRSLSHPSLTATAAAAAAAAATQHAPPGALWPGSGGAGNAAAAAAAAAAMASAQAAAAAASGLGGLSGLEMAAAQQQQQHQLALHLATLQALQPGALGGGGLSAVQLQLLQNAAVAQSAAQTLAAARVAAGLAAGGSGYGLSAAASMGNLAALGAMQGPGSMALGIKSASTNSLPAYAGGGGGAALLPGGRTSSASGAAAALAALGEGAGGGAGAPGAGGPRGGGRLSRRAADPGAESERRVQQERMFALDLDRIRRGEDKRTTLMVKNIPNKYTQKMLLQTIDEALKGCYDFFYLPIDFKNKCNVGYAFINLVQPEFIPALVERFDNRKWDKFNSEKVCHISYARIQGRAALVSHFQNSSLMHEDKRCRPVLFASDGTRAGEQEPFPVGPNVRPRHTHAGYREGGGGAGVGGGGGGGGAAKPGGGAGGAAGGGRM